MHDHKCERVYGGPGFGWSPCYCNSRPAQHAAARDEARIQAELRDRLDRCDPFAYEAALREAAHLNPDLITEALDATGAPT